MLLVLLKADSDFGAQPVSLINLSSLLVPWKALGCAHYGNPTVT